MVITREYLESVLKNVQEQHTNAVNVANQALGAVLVIQEILSKLNEDGIPIEKFAEKLGEAKVEEVK